MGQEGLQGGHSISAASSSTRQPWGVGWGAGPPQLLSCSSWQMDPGLEILVQQSTARTCRGGATLQRQSLGKMESKCRFLQGTKFVTGSSLCHLQQGAGVCPVQGHGRRDGEIFSDKAEQSQLPAANVPPVLGVWMEDLGACAVPSDTLQARLCSLPEQDSPEPGLCDPQGLEEQPTHPQLALQC